MSVPDKLTNVYIEGILANSINNATRNVFRGTTNTISQTARGGQRDAQGRFRSHNGRFKKQPFFGKAYDWLENSLETIFSLGKGLAGGGLDEELPQLKAKFYYIVLRAQPPVGVAFKKKLQQAIYDAKSVVDLDKLANQYKVYWQWRRYKEYLMQQSNRR